MSKEDKQEQLLRRFAETYASFESVLFIKWMASEGWQNYDDHDTWIHLESRIVVTAKELFDLYKKDNP